MKKLRILKKIKENLWTIIPSIFIGFVIVLLIVCTPGCIETGLRFDATEKQKQDAQIGDKIAVAMAARGIKPGSEAAWALASAMRNAATDAGPPKNPVNVETLLPPAVTGAWDVQNKQIAALKIKNKLYGHSNKLITNKLAEIFSEINKAKYNTVKIATFAQRFVAISDVAELTQEIINQIEVPDDMEMTAAEKEILEATAANAKEIQTLSAAAAAKKPSPVDVGNRVLDGMGKWVVDNPEISLPIAALIPGGTGVLAWLGKRKRRKADNQKDVEVATTKHDKNNIEMKYEMEKAGRLEAETNAAAMKDILVLQTQKLAESTPAPVAPEKTLS